MLKQLSEQQLRQLLESIADEYRLLVPIRLADGSRQLAPYGSGELSLVGEPLQRKPSSPFFPQSELLLTLGADGTVLPAPPKNNKALALFGLNHSDLAALAFLDRFFCAAPADDIYRQKRQGALLVGLTGSVGADGAVLPFSGAHCDLEISLVGQRWLAHGYSDPGKRLLHPYPAADPAQLDGLQQPAASDRQREKLLQAAELLRQDRIPDHFWQQIADRCILCAGCNYACPTCSCFCVQDRQTGTATERSRVWDSCQLDAFMREASGHNPLGSAALRTRRRIHHKLVADVERWGELGCVACGRCDRACPAGIGMFAVVEELLNRFGTQ